MGKKIIKVGFFTMEDARVIDAMQDIEEAKKYALERIAAQPNALPSNIKKATEAINKAITKNQLVLTVGSFVMAHPSEGLKVI